MKESALCLMRPPSSHIYSTAKLQMRPLMYVVFCLTLYAIRLEILMFYIPNTHAIGHDANAILDRFGPTGRYYQGEQRTFNADRTVRQAVTDEVGLQAKFA